MASGFDKIIKSVLRDRTSTPLYSSLLLSWCLWNTRIIYFTIFVSQDRVPGGINKLDYIINNYVNPLHSLVFPIVSAAAVIFLFPYAANYTYRVSLRFRRKRIDDKTNIIEKERLLSYEESEAIKSKAEQKIRQKEEQIKELSEKTESLTNQLNGANSELNSFRVLVAMYGSNAGSWVDVTGMVNTKFMNQAQRIKFQVDSQALGVGDPAPGQVKELLICSMANGKFHIKKAIEQDTVSITEQEIVVRDGDLKKRIDSKFLALSYKL